MKLWGFWFETWYMMAKYIVCSDKSQGDCGFGEMCAHKRPMLWFFNAKLHFPQQPSGQIGQRMSWQAW
jgi:hypothetical protein